MKPTFKLQPAAVAVVLFASGLALAGMGVPAFSHAVHPLALRGTAGLPQAAVFNAIVFVLPGLLLAFAGHRLRTALGQPAWAARIGIVLVQLSALAFAAQGVFPLDPTDADSSTSRLHALAWMLWWIAFVPGALCLRPGREGGGVCDARVVAAVGPRLAGPQIGLGGVAKRLAFAAGWLVLVVPGCASSQGARHRQESDSVGHDHRPRRQDMHSEPAGDAEVNTKYSSEMPDVSRLERLRAAARGMVVQVAAT